MGYGYVNGGFNTISKGDVLGFVDAMGVESCWDGSHLTKRK